MSAPPIRWGVLGATSRIAREAVLPALRDSPEATIVAVASRDEAAARSSAAAWNAASAYAGYAALLDDSAVEAVYIPLPNSLHREWVERCAAAGKHVLCEKPLGLTPEDVETMIEVCDRAGVMLVEACMTPHHPRTRALGRLLADGRLGALRAAFAAFRFPLDEPGNHRWRGSMGGGALLDVGIYCLLPVMAALGADPVTVDARSAWRGDVDASTTAWLDYGEGRTATIDVSFDAPELQLAHVAGDRGMISIEKAHTPGPLDTGLDLVLRDGSVEHHQAVAGNCYQLMVEDMGRAIRERTRPLHDVTRSLEIARLVARIRAAAQH